MSFSCVPLKPSQTGVVTPWLARRWTPQAAFTHWSGASLPTGDLIQSRGKCHTVRRLQYVQCTTPPWIWYRGVKTEGEPQNHKVPGVNIEIMEYLRKHCLFYELMRLTGAAIFWWIKQDVCCVHSEESYGRYFLVTEQTEIKLSPLNKLIELFYCTFTRNEEHLNASLVIIQ